MHIHWGAQELIREHISLFPQCTNRPVHDPAVVEVRDCLQQLLDQALDLREAEGRAGQRVDEAAEVVLAELKHEEQRGRGPARHHLQQPDDGGVPLFMRGGRGGTWRNVAKRFIYTPETPAGLCLRRLRRIDICDPPA